MLRSLLLLAATLALTASPVLSDSVKVPYKLCSSASLLSIASVESNEWPPKKGDALALNVTGVLSAEVDQGAYDLLIKVYGIGLPDIHGDIADFKPLPWTKGDFSFVYAPTIPKEAPSGPYTLALTAKNGDGTQILCMNLDFTIKMARQAAVLLDEAPIHVEKKKSFKGRLVSLVSQITHNTPVPEEDPEQPRHARKPRLA